MSNKTGTFWKLYPKLMTTIVSFWSFEIVVVDVVVLYAVVDVWGVAVDMDVDAAVGSDIVYIVVEDDSLVGVVNLMLCSLSSGMM